VTFPADLLACNLIQLGVLGETRLIGDGCRIHPGATIVNSVLADGVVVEHPIEIRDSVVFPGVTIAHNAPLRRMVLTADDIIDCRLPEA
jgi:ADP-glucose pyrophosphorylase